jgi:hypothetical protein
MASQALALTDSDSAVCRTDFDSACAHFKPWAMLLLSFIVFAIWGI